MGGRANRRLVEILAEHFNIQEQEAPSQKEQEQPNKTAQIVLERYPDFRRMTDQISLVGKRKLLGCTGLQ